MAREIQTEGDMLPADDYESWADGMNRTTEQC